MNADFPVNRGTIQSRKAVPVTAARGCDGGRLAQHFLISEALLHSFSLFYRVAASAASDIIAIFWRRQPKDAVRRFPSLPFPSYFHFHFHSILSIRLHLKDDGCARECRVESECAGYIDALLYPF